MSSVYTIPASLAFVDALAAGILARFGDDPMTLPKVQVLMPTRRACRALRDAFLRCSGDKPLLLPRMMPLGDVDADELAISWKGADRTGALSQIPEAIPPLRRQLLLTYLIMARETGETIEQAARLAADLARLQDQVDTFGLSWGGLASLAPTDFAEHWQTTLRFLDVLTTVWPELLKDQGCINPGERRNLLMKAQVAFWQESPPAYPVIAAGSTGSIPATADLLACIAAMPNGHVVLPGLDLSLDEESRKSMEALHPQFGMLTLLARLGLDLGDVAAWPVPLDSGLAATPAARISVLAEALRPTETVGAWRDAPPVDPSALEGVNLFECSNPQEEAGAIALVMREALEIPGRTAALVTPDRNLARRVAAELGRWGIVVDDSAGMPLGETPIGTFLRLTATAVAEGLSPVHLLAALKHDFVSGGQATGVFAKATRRFEKRVLRGLVITIVNTCLIFIRSTAQ